VNENVFLLNTLILGVVSLVVLVIYIIGITYKLIKIQLGTYVEEEPVFLKYK
jgi:uncharacterized membrane protein YqjE